jgi:hypothetical protein
LFLILIICILKTKKQKNNIKKYNLNIFIKIHRWKQTFKVKLKRYLKKN